MKRTSLAALLAAPALLAFPGSSPAHPPQQCSYGMGCGGLRLNLRQPKLYTADPAPYPVALEALPD